MEPKSGRVLPARRWFLASVAGGVAAAASLTRLAPAAPAAAGEMVRAGYRLTPHIRRFYEKANL